MLEPDFIVLTHCPVQHPHTMLRWPVQAFYRSQSSANILVSIPLTVKGCSPFPSELSFTTYLAGMLGTWHACGCSMPEAQRCLLCTYVGDVMHAKPIYLWL